MDPRSTSAINTTQTSAMSSAHPSPTTSNIVPPAPKPLKTPSTAAYLKDFTLLAEAAKRAEMAVLLRDMESVETAEAV
ncbi:uncharacterized protein B0T15DRAFT_500821 [Chaetomium strumarium]|uniref:Uncharacterized protein n=1 Tax=Chaetomium strumarium TaxID=1170767 RepID=A0AAJ0M4U3_9PEZI|nr:hypothetical protein B0T15DRAFT_500821 [Chaetomium strumarium]